MNPEINTVKITGLNPEIDNVIFTGSDTEFSDSGIIVGFCPRCSSDNCYMHWDNNSQGYYYKCRACGYPFTRSGFEIEYSSGYGDW
jgi:hypothetical protein